MQTKLSTKKELQVNQHVFYKPLKVKAIIKHIDQEKSRAFISYYPPTPNDANQEATKKLFNKTVSLSTLAPWLSKEERIKKNETYKNTKNNKTYFPKSTYEQVKHFHETFNVAMPNSPTPLSKEDALTRASFIAEELVELLSASSTNSHELVGLYNELLNKMHHSLERERVKEFPKDEFEKLTAQVDSLLDIDVFCNGTYTLLGVDPRKPMQYVYQANIAKLFPDGKPRYREGDGKILKPDNWVAPDQKIANELKRQIAKAKERA
mgnify:CR=1 FL=1